MKKAKALAPSGVNTSVDAVDSTAGPSSAKPGTPAATPGVKSTGKGKLAATPSQVGKQKRHHDSDDDGPATYSLETNIRFCTATGHLSYATPPTTNFLGQSRPCDHLLRALRVIALSALSPEQH